jgi:hypothetical protein
MYEDRNSLGNTINPSLLLERFLEDCQQATRNCDRENYSYSYMADTIAAIYYYREYNSCEEFLKANKEFLDEERCEWVKYMWRTLDTMSNQQRAELIIESLTQMPSLTND